MEAERVGKDILRKLHTQKIEGKDCTCLDCQISSPRCPAMNAAYIVPSL